uniref:Tetratricopeptide TPR_2 repeat protein n=1 Tax=Rhodopseudomonas palustris (strain BisA53) TaxID=316055 RepID=Q07SN7_RHOP5
MVAAWRGLAQIEEGEQNWRAVGPIWRKITALDPKDVDARMRLAKMALLSGALDEAMKLADAAAEIDPNNSTVLALRAGVLLKLNDTLGATEQARKAIELAPKNGDGIIVLSAIKFTQNDIEGSWDLLNSIPPSSPPDIGLSLFKIRVLEKKNDLAAVEREMRSLIDAYPQEKAFRTALLSFFVAHKRQDDAEKLLRLAVSTDPSNNETKLELVAFLRQVRGAQAARQHLMDQIQAGGNVFPLQIALVELDVTEGRWDGAIHSMQALIKSGLSKQNGASARLKLAEILIAQQNPSEAGLLLEEVLRSDARNVGALRLRAAIRIEEGRLEDGISDIRQALNDQPNSPVLLALLAIAYEKQGAIDLADKQLNDATKASNYAPNFALNYVAFLQRRGNLNHAEDILAEASSRNPTDTNVLSALARVRLARQNWIGAQEIADQIRKVGDNQNISDNILAASLTGQKKYDEAIGLLQSAYSANPNATQSMLGLVRAYVAAKQTDRAEAFLRAVLNASPQNVQARVTLGLVQLASNAPAKAEATFKAVIEENAKDPAGYRALADLYGRQNKLNDALQILKAGLQQAPNDVALRLGLAGLQEATRDIDGAIATYESILKDDPGSLVVANNLASLLTDYRADKESLDRAYSLATILAKTQVAQFKDTLGWINHLRGDQRAASSLLEEAASELPNVAIIKYHLGKTYLAAGQVEKGNEQLKKGLEIAAAEKDDVVTAKIRAAIKD